MSSQLPTGSQRTYDANFKLMVIREVKAMNNCEVGRKFGVSEVNISKWRQINEKLRNASSSRKSFSGPKKGRYHDLEQKVIEYLREKRNEGLLLRMKVLELKHGCVQTGSMANTTFKASVGWCAQMMKRAGLMLQCQTTLAQHIPAEYGKKRISFQDHIIHLRKQHNDLLDQIGNADQKSIYFNIPSNV